VFLPAWLITNCWLSWTPGLSLLSQPKIRAALCARSRSCAASNLDTAAARGASDRYSTPPTCAGAAAVFAAFATKTGKVAQIRGNRERNSSAADYQGGAEKIVPAAFEVLKGQFPIAPAPIIKAPVETYAEVTRTIAKAEERKNIAALLASTSGLRDAMILREILGPPRSLRAIDPL
jgi:hypothetical protein